MTNPIQRILDYLENLKTTDPEAYVLYVQNKRALLQLLEGAK